MFFTIPPAQPVKLDAPDYLKAVTLRITGMEAPGYFNLYAMPFKGLPIRFDAEHAEQRIESHGPMIWLQPMDGAERYSLELVSFERDIEAERRAREPRVIRWG